MPGGVVERSVPTPNVARTRPAAQEAEVSAIHLYVAPVDQCSSIEAVTADFVSQVRAMLGLEEYLFPYVWAQRQFRDDNYQMGSQALLEDMFFDTFGDYLQRHDAGSKLDRRTGKEPWDYKYSGVGFSHKEAVTPIFTAVWQAGGGPGNRTPVYKTWSFSHPVVFVYSKPVIRTPVSAELVSASGRPVALKGEAVTLSHQALQSPRLSDAVVLLGDMAEGRLTVDSVWSRAAWEAMTVHDMRNLLGGDRLLRSGLWLFKVPADLARRGFDVTSVPTPFVLDTGPVPAASGVYVFETASLKDVPLESNNKAHFLGTSLVQELMTDSATNGRFVPMPMWPAVYADLTPPNLYQVQKERYDDLFRARRRA